MFDIDAMKVLEIIARVALIYVACMVLLRISGRREMSDMSPMDLLAMLLVSETVSPALTGGDESVTGGVLAASVLFALCVGTGWLAFRYRKAESILQGHAAILIENGHVRSAVMQKFRISDDDLRTALHDKGLLEVQDVGRAYVEPDGHITIIEMESYEKTKDRRQHAH